MQEYENKQAGKAVVTPAEGYKWNNLGGRYQSFYNAHQDGSLARPRRLFEEAVKDFAGWVDTLFEETVFQPGGRKWASSTPSRWPVWKWIHVNTVAPFKSFRSKIRKWKKENAMNS